jgi:hypothetical protein
MDPEPDSEPTAQFILGVEPKMFEGKKCFWKK